MWLQKTIKKETKQSVLDGFRTFFPSFMDFLESSSTKNGRKDLIFDGLVDLSICGEYREHQETLAMLNSQPPYNIPVFCCLLWLKYQSDSDVCVGIIKNHRKSGWWLQILHSHTRLIRWKVVIIDIFWDSPSTKNDM